MEIKTIITDLDHTLLDEKKRISDRTLEALKKCRTRNIEIIPATGRNLLGLKECRELISLVRYAILANGAEIIDLQEIKWIKRELLSPLLAVDVLEEVTPYSLIYDVFADGTGKSESRFLTHLEDYGIEPEICRMMRKTRQAVGDVIEYVRNKGTGIEKINLYFSDLRAKEGIRMLLGSRGDIAVTSSLYNNLEITNKRANKGNAVRWLAAFLEIPLNQVMIFGDSENDATMMSLPAFTVAVENAATVIKETADYVTASNRHAGVALALEKFVTGS